MSLSESLMQKVKIHEVMNTSIVSVDSSITATDAAKMMEDTDVGAVIVFENGIPDFAIKITAHSYPIDTPIRRIMSSPLISIDSDSDLWTASDLMSTRKVRKLPVIDNDKVVGILTSSDIITHFADH